ncbi:MAG: hypothetical protein KDD70_15010, partial [Bdellovibrionales bacterium]|nr:hypothetical protein [Bdellovibrionales bacterium]
MGIYPWVIAPKRPLCQGRLILFVAFLNLLILFPFFLAAQSNPIVFVTQVPKADDFANIVSTFGNHRGTMYAAPRGGDLWIRYVDGSLKNLTETAGFGEAGRQGENAIAVRDPSVHWSGEKVLFSMVVGAPEQFKYNDYRFQLYEVTGLRKDETPVITKVPRQPAQYNNVMGTYAPDDTILFVSDRPVGGATHLYPQLDEYESTPTNTGLWKLTPSTGALEHLDHSPSGDFHPIVDSFGRVLVTRWDHLQQDQQADDGAFGAYNFQSERVNAPIVGGRAEVFPEPRSEERRISRNISLHTFNRFMP